PIAQAATLTVRTTSPSRQSALVGSAPRIIPARPHYFPRPMARHPSNCRPLGLAGAARALQQALPRVPQPPHALAVLPGVPAQPSGALAALPGVPAQPPDALAQLAGVPAQPPDALAGLPGVLARLLAVLAPPPDALAVLPGALAALPLS